MIGYKNVYVIKLYPPNASWLGAGLAQMNPELFECSRKANGHFSLSLFSPQSERLQPTFFCNCFFYGFDKLASVNFHHDKWQLTTDFDLSSYGFDSGIWDFDSLCLHKVGILNAVNVMFDHGTLVSILCNGN